MRVKKGHTVIELLVVLLIMSLIISIAFGFMGSMFKQFNNINEISDKPILKLRAINTIEEAVNGCTDIVVQPQQINITNPRGELVISASDFPKLDNIIFVLQDEQNLLVDIGGEQFWVSVSRTY